MGKVGRPPHDDHFTPAEWRVLHAVRHGLSNISMAEGMGVSVNAIKYHVRNLLEKTGLPNKKALMTYKQQSKHFSANKTNNQELSVELSNDIERIGQIARTVKDIERSKNWYEIVLEFNLLYAFKHMAFFDCNGTRLMLIQNETFNSNESILYFMVNDIVTTCENLEKKGVSFIAAPHKIHQHDDGTEEWMAFFNDPDDRPLALMSQIK